MATTDELSIQFHRYVESIRSGRSAEAVDFRAWLDAHWCAAPLSDADPCAGDFGESVGSADSVNWAEFENMIVGIRAGMRRGHYRIAIGERVPHVALMLDDDDGCSTGSLAQERAFTRWTVDSISLVVEPVAPKPKLPPPVEISTLIFGIESGQATIGSS